MLQKGSYVSDLLDHMPATSQPEVSIIPRIGGGDRVPSPTFRGWRYLPYLASHPVSSGAVSSVDHFSSTFQVRLVTSLCTRVPYIGLRKAPIGFLQVAWLWLHALTPSNWLRRGCSSVLVSDWIMDHFPRPLIGPLPIGPVAAVNVTITDVA